MILTYFQKDFIFYDNLWPNNIARTNNFEKYIEGDRSIGSNDVGKHPLWVETIDREVEFRLEKMVCHLLSLVFKEKCSSLF